MKYLGAHVSIAGGVFNAPSQAVAIGATAFAIFTKNQRQWSAAAYTAATIQKFKHALQISRIPAAMVLPHSSYLINLGHPDETTRHKSLTAFIDEIERCSQLGLLQLNFHPGYHLDLTTETECLRLIADSLNKALAATSGITLIIENTAGQGSVVGYKFEHLAEIIAQVKDKQRIGVCIDTCHLFAAGYDFRDNKSYSRTWDEFAAMVGFDYLKAMHLNDAKATLGSKHDRHASIGTGNLGIVAFKLLMRDERMDNMPLILETPDPTIWANEIKLLKSWGQTPIV